MIYIGIDPGITGGFAVLCPSGTLERCGQFPSYKELSPKGRKMSRPDIKKMSKIFKSIRKTYKKGLVIMVEKQVAMPGQNAVGTFNTGKGYGILMALIAVYFEGERVFEVNCKEWQTEMIPDRTFVESKIRRHRRKQLKLDSVAAAQKRFPGFDFTKSERSKVCSDGMTDSALIAGYCYDKYN